MSCHHGVGNYYQHEVIKKNRAKLVHVISGYVLFLTEDFRCNAAVNKTSRLIMTIVIKRKIPHKLPGKARVIINGFVLRLFDVIISDFYIHAQLSF